MRRSNSAAKAAIVLGLLAVAAMPAGAVAAQALSAVGLVQSLYVSVPVAAVLGLTAFGAARRGRLAVARSVFREGAGLARAARLLSWAGLYVAAIGGIALAVYAVLHYSG